MDAVAALFFGWLFDRIGIRSLIFSTLLSAFFAALVFLADSAPLLIAGVLLWGIGMGAQESVMKAAVSTMMPKSMRSTGFGIFETGFGIAWFLGSWLLGALYDHNPALLVAVSVSAQLMAILFYVVCLKKRQKENVGIPHTKQ